MNLYVNNLTNVDIAFLHRRYDKFLAKGRSVAISLDINGSSNGEENVLVDFGTIKKFVKALLESNQPKGLETVYKVVKDSYIDSLAKHIEENTVIGDSSFFNKHGTSSESNINNSVFRNLIEDITNNSKKATTIKYSIIIPEELYYAGCSSITSNYVLEKSIKLENIHAFDNTMLILDEVITELKHLTLKDGSFLFDKSFNRLEHTNSIIVSFNKDKENHVMLLHINEILCTYFAYKRLCKRIEDIETGSKLHVFNSSSLEFINNFCLDHHTIAFDDISIGYEDLYQKHIKYMNGTSQPTTSDIHTENSINTCIDEKGDCIALTGLSEHSYNRYGGFKDIGNLTDITKLLVGRYSKEKDKNIDNVIQFSKYMYKKTKKKDNILDKDSKLLLSTTVAPYKDISHKDANLLRSNINTIDTIYDNNVFSCEYEKNNDSFSSNRPITFFTLMNLNKDKGGVNDISENTLEDYYIQYVLNNISAFIKNIFPNVNSCNITFTDIKIAEDDSLNKTTITRLCDIIKFGFKTDTLPNLVCNQPIYDKYTLKSNISMLPLRNHVIQTNNIGINYTHSLPNSTSYGCNNVIHGHSSLVQLVSITPILGDYELPEFDKLGLNMDIYSPITNESINMFRGIRKNEFISLINKVIKEVSHQPKLKSYTSQLLERYEDILAYLDTVDVNNEDFNGSKIEYFMDTKLEVIKHLLKSIKDDIVKLLGTFNNSYVTSHLDKDSNIDKFICNTIVPINVEPTIENMSEYIATKIKQHIISTYPNTYDFLLANHSYIFVKISEGIDKGSYSII